MPDGRQYGKPDEILGWLERALLQYIRGGIITREQAADIFDAVQWEATLRDWGEPQIWDAVKAYVSRIPSPLVTKEREIELSEAMNLVLENLSISDEEKAFITGAEGKKLQAAFISGESNEMISVLGRMYKRAEDERTRALEQAWGPLSKEPLTAPYLKDIPEAEIEAYLSGKSDELLDKLAGIWGEANLAQKEAIEGQKARLALEGIRKLGEPAPKEEWVRPPMPELEPIAKSFLEETGLAKGTKLSRFLAEEFIPEVIGETRGAREEWWRRMHPELEEREDFAAKTERMREEARRWAGLAWGPEASTAEALGGVYYGEGGLAGLAETAYKSLAERLQERLAKGEEPGPGRAREPAPGPDPLIAALREKKYRPEYYRQPGAGLVSRLTPAIRY